MPRITRRGCPKAVATSQSRLEQLLQHTVFHCVLPRLYAILAFILVHSAFAEQVPISVPQLKVTGSEFVIFDWQTDRCEDLDLSDEPLHALRLANGEIFASGGHYLNRFLRGSNFGTMKRDCNLSYRGNEDPSAEAFDDRTWLMSFWTPDGVRIAALGHNEYHAERHGACRFNQSARCVYEGIIAAESSDGGRTFKRAAAFPIAAPRYRQDGSLGRLRGFVHPSSIVSDEHFAYTIIQTMPDPPQSGGECLFRTPDPLVPQAWTYLATTGTFVLSTYTPYYAGEAPPPCRPLVGLNGIVWSLLRLDDGSGFVALLTVPDHNPLRTGIALSWSRDLITWSNPNVVMTIVSAWNDDRMAPLRYSYPSLIDPLSQSRNFDTIGHAALLTMTRIHMNNGRMTLARDIVGYPAELEWTPR
jgi:hypothetical protein